MERPSEVREIEAVLESRFQGPARLVPSGRLGLIIGLESLLGRGDRVAMIASLCEVVAFSTYAAGLRPVFVDSDESAPRLDIDALRPLEARSVDAVVATNLYGIPEALVELSALCRQRNWKLIEDAAQTLESFVDGRRVGTFGDVTILSFKKFFDERCGALICHDGARLERIDAAIREYSQWPDWKIRVRARVAKAARLMGMGWLRAVRRGSGTLGSREQPPTLENTRLPYLADLLSEATRQPRPLSVIDPILSADDAIYSVYPPKAQLERLLEKVRAWDRLAASVAEAGRRISSAARDAALNVLSPAEGCYLAVPVLTCERDQWARHFWESGRVKIGNVYNPPLPDYLPARTFDDHRRFPRRDSRWSRELLPIPTAHEGRCVRAIPRFGGRLRGTIRDHRA
jgi:hypothetical protein